MKQVILCALFLILFTGCKDDSPDPIPTRDFTINVEASYPFLKNEDFWIMIHDEEGALLDAEQVKNAGSVTFQIPEESSEKVALTLFTVSSNSGATMKYYQLATYFSFTTDGTKTLKAEINTNSGSDLGNTIGTYAVGITFPNEPIMDNLVNGSISQNGSVRTFSTSIYEKGKRNVLISVADKTGPRYKWFENVKNNDYFSFTFDEMNQYDYVLDLSFPSAKDPYVAVYGYDDNGIDDYTFYYNGFYLPPSGNGYSLTNLKIGYLDRIKKYSTRFQLFFDKYSLLYTKKGGRPSPFVIPNHAPYKIQSSKLNDFSFTEEVPFTYREAFYTNRSQLSEKKEIWWTVYSPSGSPGKIREISSEILKEYPFIKQDDFTYSYSQFYTTSYSYNELIDLTLRTSGTYSLDDYQEVVWQVY